MDRTTAVAETRTRETGGYQEAEATRLNGDPAALAEQLPELGPVRLRVHSAHASQAVTQEITASGWAGNALWLGGRESGLWLYPAQWSFAFAVGQGEPEARQEGLRFVDRDGEVGLTAELTSASDRDAYARILRAHQQFAMRRPIVPGRPALPAFPGTARHAVDPSLIRELLETLADAAVPVRLEVGNRGALQAYTGHIGNPAATAEAFRVRGAGLALDLDSAAVASAWVVDIPVPDGRAHAVDLLDGAGERILRLAGRRVPGCPEERAWRTLVQALAACRLAS
ncbi:MAG: ChuX/HutX family heme-like substrate-binding protein [Thiohalorhabdus sp.]|uniref:ChuX/HutX family heme-like substrate-binding protein n=1 Tax=Thiohalorhabdus sp. TaxID=3094134 RepID=UPI00398077CA